MNPAPTWPWPSPALPMWEVGGSWPKLRATVTWMWASSAEPAGARVLETLFHLDVLSDAFHLHWCEQVAEGRSLGRSWGGITESLNRLNSSDLWPRLSRQATHQFFHHTPRRLRPDAASVLSGPLREQLISTCGSLCIPGARQILSEEKTILVSEARVRGCTWEQIGEALACSRQCAQRTYRDRRPDPLLLRADVDTIVERALVLHRAGSGFSGEPSRALAHFAEHLLE